MADPVFATAREIDTAVRTGYGEARGESDEGIAGVFWVLRNRLLDPRWGVDLEWVCLQPSQFSCWLRKDPNRPKMLSLLPESNEYARIKAILRKVLAGEIDDPTNRSNHYVVTGTPADWAEGQAPQITLGRHTFFRL